MIIKSSSSLIRVLAIKMVFQQHSSGVELMHALRCALVPGKPTPLFGQGPLGMEGPQPCHCKPQLLTREKTQKKPDAENIPNN
jgi:hypothetical protein